MHSLRSARLLARLVLAWFVLAMGVAVASPMVQPRGLDLVCVAGGLKLLADGDNDAPRAMGMDCPLCAAAGAPPPAATGMIVVVEPQSPAPLLAPGLRAAAVPPAPPARGPPALLVT